MSVVFPVTVGRDPGGRLSTSECILFDVTSLCTSLCLQNKVSVVIHGIYVYISMAEQTSHTYKEVSLPSLTYTLTTRLSLMSRAFSETSWQRWSVGIVVPVLILVAVGPYRIRVCATTVVLVTDTLTSGFFSETGHLGVVLALSQSYTTLLRLTSSPYMEGSLPSLVAPLFTGISFVWAVTVPRLLRRSRPRGTVDSL